MRYLSVGSFLTLYLFAAPGIPYNVTVEALNLAGCGERREISCFIQEGGTELTKIDFVVFTFPSSNIIVPPFPENVVIVRFDRTSIEVRWKKFTLVELKGLANYIVSYSTISTSRMQQTSNTIILPWSENSVVIRNLHPGTQYRILFSVSTTAGEAGETVAS